MEDPDQLRRQKVEAIFGELLGVRAGPEKRSMLASAFGPLKQALIANHWNEQTAFDVSFHLADWNEEAAFLVAVGLFPDRFTDDEIYAGIMAVLVHAPSHVFTAAKLAGFSVNDLGKDH